MLQALNNFRRFQKCEVFGTLMPLPDPLSSFSFLRQFSENKTKTKSYGTLEMQIQRYKQT